MSTLARVEAILIALCSSWVLGCGGAAAPSVAPSAGGEESASRLGALCARLALLEVTRCEARPGVHALASGGEAWVLEVDGLENLADEDDEEEPGRVSYAYLVVGPRAAPELRPFARAGYDDHGGQEWGEFRLGAVRVEGDTVTIEVTWMDAVPACPGCEPGEDGFGEVSRTEHPGRVTCAPRAPAEPGAEEDEPDDDRPRDEGAWVCAETSNDP